MRNLAGQDDCDVHILAELEEAGIAPFRLKESGNSEVPYTVFGCLGSEPLSDKDQAFFDRVGTTPEFASTMGSFVFTRAWYYWRVSGFVPLSVAEEMYMMMKLKNQYDVRVAGHGSCPPPSEWVVRYKVCGMDVVDSYHIDSQAGLNYFVQTMIKHGLV